MLALNTAAIETKHTSTLSLCTPAEPKLQNTQSELELSSLFLSRLTYLFE